jgi:hypothetical protein
MRAIASERFRPESVRSHPTAPFVAGNDRPEAAVALRQRRRRRQKR